MRRKKAQQEVETLKKKLETQQETTDTNIREFEVKEAEVQRLQEEIQRMETLMESNNMEEHTKKDVEPDTSHSKEPNQTSCYTQDSHSGFIIEVHTRQSFCLKNTFHEDQQLGGWELKLQMNKTTPFTYTFEDSFKLNTGGDVTITCKNPRDNPADLVWEDLQFWNPGDKLQFSLSSNTGEDQHIVVKNLLSKDKN
ncbi:lamin-A-like [Trematomus bernacchii]|uniref:lamin-A-like n=1 Tax=Trematomus bernacchii TaxID=40690 RepID=UPI00146E996F|nr:lamin-A-like [Trematomus bernacchii]